MPSTIIVEEATLQATFNKKHSPTTTALNSIMSIASKQSEDHDHGRSWNNSSNANKRIWGNNTPPPQSSELDFLRDCDTLTSSTTLSSASTLPSKVSFDGDLGKLGKHKSLEIPDLNPPEPMPNTNDNNSYIQRVSDQHSNQDKSRSQPLISTAVHAHVAHPLHQHQHQQRANGNGNANANANVQHPYYTNMKIQNTGLSAQASLRPTDPQGPPHNVYFDSKNQWSNQILPSNTGRLQPQSQQWHNVSYQQIASPHPHQSRANERRQEASPSTVPSVTYRQQPHGNGDTYASKMLAGPTMVNSPRLNQYHHPYQQPLQSQQHMTRPRSLSNSTPDNRPASYHPNYSHSQSNNWQPSQPYRSGNATHSTGKPIIPGSPHTRPHHHSASSYAPSGGSRPAPEVLKTLLRKKACLYEAGTSRAIALITWLVGRHLALHNGYFSRQRLQSGVHAVVARKIESGMITRTKVNRCMQIILNSCFHYIIPRPDGTEENGEGFRLAFKETAEDDTHLLKSLLAPWDDLDVTDADKAIVDGEDEAPVSPKGMGGADAHSKRLVLLCFNENVRSAEDVLRCHNDFIRDAAISSNLHLSSDEWRYFFSRKDDDCSLTSVTVDSSTSGGAALHTSPVLRGAEGCDIPYLSFDIPAEVSDCLAFKDPVPEPCGKSADALGQMNSNELSKFRTTWCCKRYDHGARLCRFAHVNENRGWLRRDPTMYQYSDQMCPYIGAIESEDSVLNGCHINACEDGLLCKFAHSQEEVDYHPTHYKIKVCESAKGPSRSCNLLDICPHSHPNHPGQNPRPSSRKKHDTFSRKGGAKSNCPSAEDNERDLIPEGAPLLYLNPAPCSEFDKSLQFAGLRGLYRRNCTVHYALHLGLKGASYSLFGNNCGLEESLFKPEHGSKDSFSLSSE